MEVPAGSEEVWGVSGNNVHRAASALRVRRQTGSAAGELFA